MKQIKVAPHYRLIKEHPASFEMHDTRDGRSFHVAKRSLDESGLASMAKVKKFADGGDTGSGGDIDYGALLSQEAAANAPYGTTPIPAPVDPQAQTQAAPNALPTPAAITTQGQPPDAGDVLAAGALANNQPMVQERGTLQAASKAEQDAARDTANAYELANNEREVNMGDLSDMMTKAQDSNQQLMDAYASKSIDPNHYWNSKSTGSKIAAGLGMILGGMGAHATNGQNMAMNTINQAIERDMDAQKNDQSKSMNLWKMNREATQSDMAAKVDFMNQSLLGVKAKAQQYAAQAGGAQAAARYAPLISDLTQRINQGTMHAQLLKAASSGAQLDVDPALLLGSVPEKDRPAAQKEIANAQEIKKLKDDFQSSYDDLNGRALGGMFSPSDRASAINSFAGRIAKLSEGRFNLEEAKLQAQALLPGIEGSETRANKQVRLDKFFDSMSTSPVFKGATGIGLDRFKSTGLGMNPVSEMPQSQSAAPTRGGVPYRQQIINGKAYMVPVS